MILGNLFAEIVRSLQRTEIRDRFNSISRFYTGTCYRFLAFCVSSDDCLMQQHKKYHVPRSITKLGGDLYKCNIECICN